MHPHLILISQILNYESAGRGEVPLKFQQLLKQSIVQVQHLNIIATTRRIIGNSFDRKTLEYSALVQLDGLAGHKTKWRHVRG